MTDGCTDETLDPSQRERIAQLRAKRGQAPSPPTPNPSQGRVGSADLTLDSHHSASRAEVTARKHKGRHPAIGGRIAAVGIGASGVFGIVTAFGAASASPDEAAADESPATELSAESLLVDPASITNRPSTTNRLVIDGGTVAIAERALPRSQALALKPGSSPVRVGAEVPSATPTPIYLTANPIVRTITVPAPPIFVVAPAPVPAGLGQAPPVQAAPVQAAPAQAAQAQEAAAPVFSEPASAPGEAIISPAPVVIQPAPTGAQVPAPAPVPVISSPAPAPEEPAPPPPTTSGSR